MRDIVDDDLTDLLTVHGPLHILADGRLGEVLLCGLLMIDLDLDHGLDRSDIAGHRLCRGHAFELVADLLRRVFEFLRVGGRERDVDRLRTRGRALARHLDVTGTVELVELLLQVGGDRLRRDSGLRVDDIRARQRRVIGEAERCSAQRQLIVVDIGGIGEDVLDFLRLLRCLIEVRARVEGLRDLQGVLPGVAEELGLQLGNHRSGAAEDEHGDEDHDDRVLRREPDDRHIGLLQTRHRRMHSGELVDRLRAVFGFAVARTTRGHSGRFGPGGGFASRRGSSRKGGIGIVARAGVLGFGTGGDEVALLVGLLRRLLLCPPLRQHRLAAATDLGLLSAGELDLRFTLTEEPVREDGHDRQRHKQGGEQGDRRGQGEGPEHLAGLPRHERQRQEHGHRGQGRRGDGPGHLGDGGEDVREFVATGGMTSSDRLDDDDGVVDDAAHGDRQRSQGEHIEGLPAHPQPDHGDEEGERNGDGGDDRRPHREQEDKDDEDREDQAQPTLVEQVVDGLLDERCLVERGDELSVVAHHLLEFRQLVGHRV